MTNIHTHKSSSAFHGALPLNDDIDMVLVDESEFLLNQEKVESHHTKQQEPSAAAATVVPLIHTTLSSNSLPSSSSSSHICMCDMLHHVMGGVTVTEDRTPPHPLHVHHPSRVPAAAAMTHPIHDRQCTNTGHDASTHSVSSSSAPCAAASHHPSSAAAAADAEPSSNSLPALMASAPSSAYTSSSIKHHINLMHRRRVYDHQRAIVVNSIYDAWFHVWRIPPRHEYGPYLRQFTLPLNDASHIYTSAVSLMHLMTIGEHVLNQAQRRRFLSSKEHEFYFANDLGGEVECLDYVQVSEPEIMGYMGWNDQNAYYCVHPHNKIGQKIGRLLDKSIQPCTMGLPAFKCSAYRQSSEQFPSASSSSSAAATSMYGAAVDHSHPPILLNPNLLEARHILELPVGVYVKFQREIRLHVGVEVNLTWLCAIIFLHLIAKLKQDFMHAATKSFGIDQRRFFMMLHQVNDVALWAASLNRMPYSIDLRDYVEAPRKNEEFLAWIRQMQSKKSMAI